jgi:hypothetical protein
MRVSNLLLCLSRQSGRQFVVRDSTIYTQQVVSMLEKYLRYAVLIAAIQQVIFPIFVNPFTPNARPVQSSIPSQLEPAGYAFVIWGAIYFLALAYGIWQLTPAGRADPVTLKIAPLAIVLYLGSSVWLSAAKYGPLPATSPILAVMALCAVLSLLMALEPPARTGLAWWAVVLPFALYAGWTTCATFVNFAEVMPAAGFNRFGLSVAGFALLSLTVVGVISAFLVWRTNANLPFAATIVWALVAIAVAGMERGADRSVVYAAFAGAAGIALLAAFIRLVPRSD